jgi:hypothetical protein
MSKQRHRRRSQGGTSPETTPQTASEVAHFSVSEVVQFWMSVDRRHGGWGQRVIEGARLGENSKKFSAIKNVYLTIECCFYKSRICNCCSLTVPVLSFSA